MRIYSVVHWIEWMIKIHLFEKLCKSFDIHVHIVFVLLMLLYTKNNF